jgi:4-amino-4-deoxy-L-arabinose transferase-like glycosyltransferase
MCRERLRDYAILLAAAAALTLPNLGAPSLWDVDEGVNAQAAREMRDNDTWVIPTFNYKLRTAKPVMQYWLQRVSYAAFGVDEWSARLPSVLAAWGAVLLTYELARRMFDRLTGLLAGVVLASAFEFCMLAHAATPDAVLLVFTVLTYYLFWRNHEGDSRKWWVPTAAACALAVLTKGPIGVALPGLVLLLYFAWNRELLRLLDRKILTAGLVFLLLAGPWYGLVTAETRGAWLQAFLGRENMQRFTTPMENHRGPIFYHAAALFVLFAPWSAFIVGAVWYGAKATREEPTPQPPPCREWASNIDSSQTQPTRQGSEAPSLLPRAAETASAGEARHAGTSGGGWGVGSSRAHRFLICWFGAYLVFFSIAATKLPNYILPLYPALAILTARFLTRWHAGTLAVPKWLMPAAVAGVALTGVVAGGGMFVASGAAKVLPDTARLFPGLERWAFLGLIPLGASVLMARALRAGDRGAFVRVAAVAAVLFTALLSAFPPLVIDERKAARELVRQSGTGDPGRDLRLAQFHWFQPSLVFYTGREVSELKEPEVAAAFLAVPTPAYVFVPEQTWERNLRPHVAVPTRVVARRYDFYRNLDILVVTNDLTAP